jgi:hypothetical protein
VIYTHGGGRLGNQILRFAHWIAWCLAHGEQVQVLNVGFWPYSRFFECWRAAPSCLFAPRLSVWSIPAAARVILPPPVRGWVEGGYRVPRIIHRLGDLVPGWQAISLNDAAGEELSLDGTGFLEYVQRRPVTTCAGWRISSWAQLERFSSEVRRYLVPARSWQARGSAFLHPIREKHDMVIGVLVRQTDYRTWLDGRFFYTLSEYVNWMHEVSALHAGLDLAFVVAADEWHDPAAFSGLNVYFTQGAINSRGHWFDSFIALSLCDLILTPPSTFSATAAFLGSIPLLPLSEPHHTLTRTGILENSIVGAANHEVFRLAVA